MGQLVTLPWTTITDSRQYAWSYKMRWLYIQPTFIHLVHAAHFCCMFNSSEFQLRLLKREDWSLNKFKHTRNRISKAYRWETSPYNNFLWIFLIVYHSLDFWTSIVALTRRNICLKMGEDTTEISATICSLDLLFGPPVIAMDCLVLQHPGFTDYWY